MDFSTDIKFSRNLIRNETTKITYSGYLFKNNSDSVSIVYGFGDNWSNTQETEMEKLENGFVAQIHILDFDKLNFCFRNSNYEWDNNYNQNYICHIEEKQDQVTEESFIINEENVVTDILDNLFENNISDIKDTTIEANKKTEATTIDAFENTINDIEVTTIEAINTPIDFTETTTHHIEIVNVENHVITTNENNTENIETETFEDSIKTIQPDTMENDINVDIAEIENGLEKDIENIFNDLYEGTSKIFETSTTKENDIENIETNIEENQENKKFDMDGLINEILAPIANSSSFENINLNSEEVIDNGLVDNILSDTSDSVELVETTNEKSDSILNTFNSEEAPLIDVIEASNENNSLVKVDTLDDYLVSARSLSKFYILKKRIKFALYKLFVAVPKIISHALSEDED